MFAWPAAEERERGGVEEGWRGAAFPLRLCCCCWCCATSGFYGFTVSSFASCSDSKSSSRIIRNAPARNNGYGYEWNNEQRATNTRTQIPHLVQMVLSFAHPPSPLSPMCNPGGHSGILQLVLSLFRQALGIIIKVLRPSGSCQSASLSIHRQCCTAAQWCKREQTSKLFSIFGFSSSMSLPAIAMDLAPLCTGWHC